MSMAEQFYAGLSLVRCANDCRRVRAENCTRQKSNVIGASLRLQVRSGTCDAVLIAVFVEGDVGAARASGCAGVGGTATVVEIGRPRLTRAAFEPEKLGIFCPKKVAGMVKTRRAFRGVQKRAQTPPTCALYP
mmetsp:Transcript_14456/g.38677  ORF Transcript_14456/g.38677 Transcript_14456/m.38677 type:complete len:133 (-) Transcript_14456:1196-1594(-)